MQTSDLTDRSERSTALERASEYIARGPANSWTATSRFGLLGLLARRSLERLIRPYAVRQREFDAAVVDALQETGTTFQRLGQLAQPLPDDAVEVETVIGPLWLDAADRLITPLIEEYRSWELDVCAVLERSLGGGKTFVDVGANVGYFSVFASRIVGGTGRVLALEPDVRTLPLLRANLWRHRCRNAVVVPAAAYRETGHVRLTISDEGRAGSRVDPEGGAGPLVPAVRLDDLLGGAGVDAIKIDVEAGEYLAIEGAEQTIARSPGLTIVAEFWPGQDHLGGRSPADVLAYYESLGLQLCLLRTDGGVEPASAVKILEAGATTPIMNIVLRKP